MTKPITFPRNLYQHVRKITMLLLFCLGSYFAQAQPSFCISNAVGTSSITVDVTVADFNEVIGMQFPIQWDSNVLEFDSVSNLGLLGLNAQANFVNDPNQPGILKFLWAIGIGTSLPDGSIIFSITFNVLSSDFSFIEIIENSPTSIPPFIFEVGILPNLSYSFHDVITKPGSVNGLVSTLSGQLFKDSDLDCSLSSGEEGLADWILKVEGDNNTYYTSTDENGVYNILLDTGTYEVTPQILNNYWGACQNSTTVTLDGTNDVVEDIPIQPIVSCPYMNVDISVPFLRRCFENKYTVSYCNQGTVIANNASIEVELDNFLTIVSTSIPIAGQNGNMATFDLGDVEVGQCESFQIVVLVSCEAELGITHCTNASIFPNELCDPPLNWSGADLQIRGECNATNDAIEFTITNIGIGDMSNGTESIVIEDAVMMLHGTPVDPLVSNESRTISYPANGSTVRMEVEQVADHPFGGSISATVEGCGDDGLGGGFIFVNQFSVEHNNPFTAVDCRINVGAYDPNDKQAFPSGYGDENYIKDNTDIEYLIRFQNTGTDTAFNVVIHDTLSNFLNVGSFRLGASSHPVEFSMEGNGIVVFSFDNIMLPDSNINEAASHGFVQFKISQKENLPNGTILENDAAIFFDFNEPIITNTVFHTIGEDFISVNTQKLFLPNLTVHTFPNPFQDVVQFEVEGAQFKSLHLNLYDLTGRLVRTATHSENKFPFYRNQLLSGIYFYTLSGDGEMISSGKITVQ